MKVDIIVYEQEKFNKEDKIINRYNLLKTNEYINNNSKVIAKKNINTYTYTNKKLADANFVKYNGSLKDFNLKVDNEKIATFDGIFELLVICITENAIYYNMYITVETPLGMVHHKAKLNPIILDEHTIQF